MKKRIAILGVLLIMMLSIVGCTKTGECDGCRQNEKLNEYVTSSGTTRYYCDYCYNMAKLAGE